MKKSMKKKAKQDKVGKDGMPTREPLQPAAPTKKVWSFYWEDDAETKTTVKEGLLVNEQKEECVVRFGSTDVLIPKHQVFDFDKKQEAEREAERLRIRQKVWRELTGYLQVKAKAMVFDRHIEWNKLEAAMIDMADEELEGVRDCLEISPKQYPRLSTKLFVSEVKAKRTKLMESLGRQAKLNEFNRDVLAFETKYPGGIAFFEEYLDGGKKDPLDMEKERATLIKKNAPKEEKPAKAKPKKAAS